MPTHVEVSLSRYGCNDGVILLEQIQTIDKKRLREKIGELTDKEMVSVDIALGISLSANISEQHNTNTLEAANPYINTPKDEWEKITSLIDERFESLSTDIKPIINRHELFKGKLNEFAVVEYFEHCGYEAERAGNLLDHLKIDVIAKNKTEKIFIQVKAGQASKKEIKHLVESVCSLNKPHIEEHLKIIACICAERFPLNSEIIRKNLELEFEIMIMFIHKYQILKACPDFSAIQ